VAFPHTEAIRAQADREYLEAGIGGVEQTSEETLGARIRPAQNGEAPTVATGPVDLPTQRANRRAHVDCGLGVRANDAGVKLALRLGVVGHGLSERAEVRGEEGAACRFGRAAQLVEQGSVRALLGQTGDDTVVHGR